MFIGQLDVNNASLGAELVNVNEHCHLLIESTMNDTNAGIVVSFALRVVENLYLQCMVVNTCVILAIGD
tara:strand:- start:1186 stop:1392 length:207 start_codon:yes stop_codon:yes gene_type:complete